MSLQNRQAACGIVGGLMCLCGTSAFADPPGGSGAKWTVEASNPNDDITAVKVTGTPYQMGWWYGNLLGTETRDNIDKVFTWSGMSEPEMAYLLDGQLWPRMSPHIAQAFHDELQGIVDGAAEADPPVTPALTLTEMRRLVCFVEMIGLECTSICAVGSATHDGRLIQLRVLDTELGTGGQDNPVITVYKPDDGPAYCNVGFAGVIGSLAGINAEGIAMSEVGLHTPGVSHSNPSTFGVYEGIPMAMLMKKVLAEAQADPNDPNDTALAKAIDIIETGPRTTNYSYGVGDGAIRDARSVITSRAQGHYWGTNTAVTIHHASDPNTKWLWDPNDPNTPDGFSGCDDDLPAVVDLTYLPNNTNKMLDLLEPSSPNYIGPLEPNNAIEVARRLSLGANLMDVVYDGEALKLWVAYAEGLDRAANREFVAFDFGAAIQTHSLTLNTVNGGWGHVDVDPNLAEYEPNSTVTLTASANPNKSFTHWKIYDPNFPGDANYAAIDANASITIVMNADREVTAVFKCGQAAAPMLPATLVMLGVLAMARRRP